MQRSCSIPSYRVVIVTTLFFYTDVQLGTTLPAALLGKVPTIGAVEELGSKEGQGVRKAEAPQQQALGLVLAEMGSLSGWLVAQGAAGEQRSQGCWIGEGLPAIPKKLLEKLHRWEFCRSSRTVSPKSKRNVEPRTRPPAFHHPTRIGGSKTKKETSY